MPSARAQSARSSSVVVPGSTQIVAPPSCFTDFTPEAVFTTMPVPCANPTPAHTTMAARTRMVRDKADLKRVWHMGGVLCPGCGSIALLAHDANDGGPTHGTGTDRGGDGRLTASARGRRDHRRR